MGFNSAFKGLKVNAYSVLVKFMYRDRSLNCIYLLICGSFWLHYKLNTSEESQHHLSFSWSFLYTDSIYFHE